MKQKTTPEQLERARRIAHASHDHGSIAWCAAFDAALSAILQSDQQLAELRAQADAMAEALAKISPISVQMGADYAEVYFADGSTHITQAMTMNPQDWLDLEASLTAYREYQKGRSDGE